MKKRFTENSYATLDIMVKKCRAHGSWIFNIYVIKIKKEEVIGSRR